MKKKRTARHRRKMAGTPVWAVAWVCKCNDPRYWKGEEGRFFRTLSRASRECQECCESDRFMCQHAPPTLVVIKPLAKAHGRPGRNRIVAWVRGCDDPGNWTWDDGRFFSTRNFARQSCRDDGCERYDCNDGPPMRVVIRPMTLEKRTGK